MLWVWEPRASVDELPKEDACLEEGRPPSTINQEEATHVSVDQEQKTKDKCIGRYWKRYNPITVVRTELAKKMRWQIHPTKGPRVLTASGELLLTTGEVRQPLFVGSRSLDEVPVYVSPDYDGFILGMDWLKKQGAFS